MDLNSVQKPFIWRKKYEEQGIEIDEKKIEEENRRRAEANKVELEKIKERRRKQELEYQQRLNDSEFLQRQKEAEQHEHWNQQEETFILKQYRQRSKIRIRDGRPQPIDLFDHYIDIFGFKKEDHGNNKGYVQEEEIDLSDSPIELVSPCDCFNGLQLSDLQSLEPDIKNYMNADCKENQQYWNDLLDITRNEMVKLQAAKEHATVSDINSAVLNDVMSLFEGKSVSELNDMEAEMEEILHDDNPSVDVSFYKSAVMRLRAYRAKIRLTTNHKINLRRQKDKILDAKVDHKITRENPDERIKPEVPIVTSTDDSEVIRSTATEDAKNNEDDGDNEDEDLDEDAVPLDRYEETQKICIDEYKKSGYSPKMCRRAELDPGIICVDFKKDYELLTQHRNTVCRATSLEEARMATMTSEEREFMNAASKGMNSREESAFSCEAPVRGPDNRNQTYIWADKYQPRKPRYFNRVHTGFEWNKYNQTHYDIDNPPPKSVQGYKFNIFYPDLIDKSKAPEYTITPCKDDKDFCIIRFSAGPPYEDIAFKIVNREWNNSHKSGFRCQFINNMLQLWFQFKRYRYRR